MAFVVGDAQWPDPDRLCVDNIARFKRPKRYLRLLELPKNTYDKVLRPELRKMLEDKT